MNSMMKPVSTPRKPMMEGRRWRLLPDPSATGESHLRPEVIVPTITCDDAAALSTPPLGRCI